MVGTGVLHKSQALAGGINLAQGNPYRFAILCGDQGISCAEHGFMCEARSAFNPQASAQGWRLLLAGDPVA